MTATKTGCLETPPAFETEIEERPAAPRSRAGTSSTFRAAKTRTGTAGWAAPGCPARSVSQGRKTDVPGRNRAPSGPGAPQQWSAPVAAFREARRIRRNGPARPLRSATSDTLRTAKAWAGTAGSAGPRSPPKGMTPAGSRTAYCVARVNVEGYALPRKSDKLVYRWGIRCSRTDGGADRAHKRQFLKRLRHCVSTKTPGPPWIPRHV